MRDAADEITEEMSIDPASSPHRKTRKPSRALKLDRKKVLEVHGKGLNVSEIARHQQVAASTVWRYLQQSQPERQALEQFKSGRADVLARIQAKSLDLQESIIDSLKENGVLVALTPHQKTGLISVLSAQMGTAYDKERLERNLSTANHSFVHKLMAAALDRVGKEPANDAPQEPEPEG